MSRECGDCQLCCKLLPVNSIDKLGGHKCKHQCATGCAVYDKLFSVAPECKAWNCEWLLGNAGQLDRPDRSHIVIDVMPDYITITENVDGTGRRNAIPALQVWIDPEHRDAHRDPALRTYLEKRGKDDGMVAIIRFAPDDGFVLFPPSLTPNGEWFEHWSKPQERTHTAREVFDAIGETRVKSRPKTVLEL